MRREHESLVNQERDVENISKGIFYRFGQNVKKHPVRSIAIAAVGIIFICKAAKIKL
jgi:hypothetical protein